MDLKRCYWYRTLAVALCSVVVSTSVSAAELVARPSVAHPGAPLFRQSGSMAKLDTALANIVVEYQAYIAAQPAAPGSQSAAASFRPGNRFVRFQQGMMLIEATASGNGQQLMDDLVSLGMRDASVYESHVAGWLPVELIETAAGLASVQSLSATLPPVRNDSGIAPTPGFPQGDKALRALNARSSYLVDGTGISIGVISDSYDKSDLMPLTDAAADIISLDLPAGNPVISGGEYPLCGGVYYVCTDEGRAMMQIIHDLAPAASLLFHTGLPNPVTYANAIADLVSAGADVIVDDLSYLNEPMFQDGIMAQAVDTAVADGVSYYSAAGNQGRESYESAFVESVEVLCIGTCDPITGLVGPAHDFDTTPPDAGAVCNPAPGDFAPPECNIDTLLDVTVPVNAALTVVLQWDEPFGNVNTGDGPQSDLVIALLDVVNGTLVEIAASDNVLNGNPVEILQFINDGNCPTFPFCLPAALINGAIVVAYDAVDSPGPPPGLMKMIFYVSPGIVLDDLDAGYATNSSTIVGHQNAAGAVAVGAAFYADTPEFLITPPLLEAYSSAGGTPILFNTSGVALPAPVIREKPEIVAVDGVSTTFFSTDQVGDAFPDFFGTSAAAPHAAAVAALVMEANSTIPPWKITNALKTTAVDMGAAGFDFDTGFGLIQADAAVAAALAVTASPTSLGATTISASQIDLAWTDNSTNETGFDVERSPSGAGTWSLRGSVTAGVAIFSDTGLASNTPFDYRVKATYDSGSDSGYSNTASATTFDGCPAGPHAIPAGTWRTFSLACNPAPGNTVADVFSNLVAGDYDVSWVVYRWDAVAGAYVKMLATSVMAEGVGYFVQTLVSTTVSINGFPNSGVDISLAADGVALRNNLLGHNRNGLVAWADVKIIDGDAGNAVYTLAQADPDLGGGLGRACEQLPAPHASCLMSRKMYKWNGSAYLMYDGETLGMEGSLQSFDGFWVKAFRSGVQGISLRIPLPTLPPVPAVAASDAAGPPASRTKGRKPTATPWYIRLIAESEGKQDPGNVLGQMATSGNGQDRHDLEETYPFDSSYLSILFTNPGFEQVQWGFTSDFRKLARTPKGRWPFVVKASADVESVTLRWEGDAALFDKAYLLDVQSDSTIRANPDGSYTFDVQSGETPFVFILKK